MPLTLHAGDIALRLSHRLATPKTVDLLRGYLTKSIKKDIGSGA
jgi:hypothetical protein